MKIPADARSRFDALLTLPLEKTPTHKKELLQLRDQVRALPQGQEDALKAIERGLALLDRVERKTSPLYLRLIHAAARFLSLPPEEAPWPLRLEVARAVAHATKNFDLEVP